MIRVLLALAAGLALADASVVTLGLPPILDELDASVNGAAAVLGVYTAVLAAALLPAEWLRRRAGTRATGAGGLLLFAVAGVACGAADTLAVLIAARGAQAAGAAAALVAVFAALGGGRMWAAAAVLGIACGPALGGALTEWFDWRAIFYVQAPVGAAAAAAMLAARTAGGAGGGPRPVAGGAGGVAGPAGAGPAGVDGSEPPGRPGATAADDAAGFGPRAGSPDAAGTWSRGALIALALVSAALTGVLFLLVLLLVSGWSVSPLAAAATVSVLPLAAFAGLRIPGSPRRRAAAGSALLSAGVLALAFLPEASVAWTLAPQAVAGVGMGMALPALAGQLLPERTPHDAAWLLTVRHVGITLALALLAPVVSERLDQTVVDVRERGAALVLDAELEPLDKIQLASALVEDLDPVDPRAALERSLAENARPFQDDAGERAAYATLRRRADETLVAGVTEAFSVAFLITGAFALLAAPATGRPRWALAALALPVAMALAKPSIEPEPVRIANPCERRDIPRTGGIGGFLQEAALVALDRAACDAGTSREELVLAIADPALAREYEREHGVNPREVLDDLDDLGGILDLF